MGSEGPKAITIHVTGFKKFLGVSGKPTEKIVNNLNSYVEKRGLPCRVLVAALFLRLLVKVQSLSFIRFWSPVLLSLVITTPPMELLFG